MEPLREVEPVGLAELHMDPPTPVPYTGAGHMLEFDPGERRTVSAREDARLLLMLTPWPGDGHPGALSLEEKAEVREKAARRG